MGSLNLPTGSAVSVETPSVIYTVERHPLYAPLLYPLWQAAQAQSLRIISSALQAAYERLLLATPEVRLLPLTQEVLREAARLRATIPGLRTPDALHAATALGAGCALFLTNDAGFRRVPGLPLAILDDVLAS